MKIKKMARRGGRPKLSPSKRTESLLERLDEIGFDPVAELIRDLSQIDDPFQRAQIIERMWRYIYPQRKAVDFSATTTTAHVSLTPDEVREIFNSDPFVSAIEVGQQTSTEPPHPPMPKLTNSQKVYLDEVEDSVGGSPDEEDDPLG